MSTLTARQGLTSSTRQQPLPRRCGRTPMRPFCCTSMTLNARNYKEEQGRRRKYLGTDTVYLSWEYEKGEDEFLELCTAFAKYPAFENVTSVTLHAPHLPLDGRFIDVLGKGKPLAKELSIEAWTFHSGTADMWAGFKQLHSLDLDLSDGRHFPNCFNDVLSGRPSSLKLDLKVRNRGPHYGAVDCALLPLGMRFYYLKGLALQNWARLFDERRGGWLVEVDCKRGVPSRRA